MSWTLFCLQESGLNKVRDNSLASIYKNCCRIFEYQSVDNIMEPLWIRQALDLVCQPLACLKNRCGSSQRDAWLEAYGATSKRKRYLPGARRAFLAMFRWNHPLGHPKLAWKRSSHSAHSRWNYDDHCRLSDPLSKVSKHRHHEPPPIHLRAPLFNFLFFSSVTFAMRKQLQAEHGKADLDRRIAELESKKKS